MTYKRIREYAETYHNGNISTAKAIIKRMSKADFLEFLNCLAAYGNYSDNAYYQAVNTARELV